MKRLICLLFFASSTATANDTFSIKNQILSLAESYQGQGDPDGSKQRSLETLVEELLKANPQPPVQERLGLIYGAWKQIWGPYDYRNNDRGVDPTLDVKNIYQVVFSGGYYYNVNPSLDRKGNVKNTVLLRGEFRPVANSEDTLQAKFTDLRRLNGLPPADLRLQDLPALSEARVLPGERTVLPRFLVRRFFGGGLLKEVYTDEDLRITFGSGENDKVSNYIYILKRAK